MNDTIYKSKLDRQDNNWYRYTTYCDTKSLEDNEKAYLAFDFQLAQEYKIYISNIQLIPINDIIITDPKATQTTINNYLSNKNVTSIDVRAVSKLGTLTTPANLNCLLYGNENLKSGWSKNVVVDGVCANLELTDKQPFNAKEQFNATKATYTRTAYTDGGWESIMLPFAVETLPEGFVFDTFTSASNESAVFEEVTSISANTPYLMKSKEKVEETTNLEITASNVTISPATDTETFKGVYQTISGENKYLLNGNGDGFGLGTATSTVEPFRGYLDLESTNSASKVNIMHRAVTGIDTQTQTTFKVWGMSQAIMVNTPQPIKLAIRNLAGQLIKTVSLTEGTHQIDNLAAGIYLVGNQKVAIYE